MKLGAQSEAANGGVLQINYFAPTRKLKLDKLPGANNFAEHIKILPVKLEIEERGQNFQKFSCRAHQYLPGKGA